MQTKVISVELNKTLVSKANKSYVAHELVVHGSAGPKVIRFLTNDSNLGTILPTLQSLTPGSEVDVKFESDGKFMKAVAVTKLQEGTVQVLPADKPKFGGFNRQPQTPRDNSGVIKGNSVTNGVQLAIARHGKDVTIEQVRKATLEVLSLHKALDAVEKVEEETKDIDF